MKFQIKYLVLIILIVILITAIAYLGYYNYLPVWFGLGETPVKKDYNQAKTLWDWLELLIIPFVLALGGLLYKESENKRQEKKELKKEQEEKLERFFDSFPNFIDQQLTINLSKQTDKTIVAKKKLNLLLSQINNNQKGLVLQFLYESNLLKASSVFKLDAVSFSGINADNIILREAYINGTWFNNGSFKSSFLDGATFSGCDFTGADLSNCDIENVKFDYCNLNNCKLEGMDLTTVDFTGSKLNNASLKDSRIKQEQLDKIIEKQNLKTTKLKVI